MNAKRAVFLSIFFALFISSRQQCPPPGLACSDITTTGGWVSLVTSARAPREAFTASQSVDWEIDSNRPGQQYRVGYRPRVSGGQWNLSDATSMSDNFLISGLRFDTQHELIVCYDNVTIDRLPVPGSSDPIVPECGQCMSCFTSSMEPMLNVVRAVRLDSPSATDLIYEIEVSSIPPDVEVTWIAADRQSPNDERVILTPITEGVEITFPTESPNFVSRLVVPKGSRYRNPSANVTNGLRSELRENFSRVSVAITEATVQDIPSNNRVEYRCVVSGSPDVTVTWQAVRMGSEVPLRRDSSRVIEVEMESSPGSLTGELVLERNNPYTMIRCLANLEGFSISESNFVDFTEPTSQMNADMTQPSPMPSSSIPLEIVIPLVVAPMIVTPICVLLGILLYRRCRIMSKKKKLRATIRMNALPDDLPHQARSGTSTPNGNMRLTPDLERTIEKSVNEEKEGPIMMLREKLPDDMIIDPTELKVSVVIGQGEFGVIYKANYYHRGDVNVVAVKTLKGIFTTAGDIESATKEILKMYRFNHVNVMSLIGVCMSPSSQGSSSGGPSMVMPFMANGSLLDYLRTEASNLKATKESEVTRVRKPLLQICQQIAKGMEYLSGMKFIHRDLAARNCLMDAAGVIKVSDFGLTENLYSRNYFREVKDGAKLPIKWMALESIKLGVFTERTDVWAYGVTCWEVFTGGSIPYPGLHPREVLDILENGERLQKPKNLACCSAMYKLLCSCWYEQSEERPTFSEIVQELEHFLELTSDYLDLGAVSTCTADTDDDGQASRVSSNEADTDEVAPLRLNSSGGSLGPNRHSILDRVFSSPNEYSEAGF